ncbi:MAG: cupin domain-containing protein [Desulfobacterales bacterium]|nr:cupin domain-containing protein [Desulfobacterales bacterium]
MPETPAVNGIVKPQANALMTEVSATDTFTIIGKMPTQRQHVCYEDTTRQMFTGTWESTPFESEMKPFPRNEMVYLLESSVTLTGEEGTHDFKTGDAFFIPMGTICRWRTPEYVRAFFSVFQPAGGSSW